MELLILTSSRIIATLRIMFMIITPFMECKTLPSRIRCRNYFKRRENDFHLSKWINTFRRHVVKDVVDLDHFDLDKWLQSHRLRPRQLWSLLRSNSGSVRLRSIRVQWWSWMVDPRRVGTRNVWRSVRQFEKSSGTFARCPWESIRVFLRNVDHQNSKRRLPREERIDRRIRTNQRPLSEIQ